MTEAYEDGWLVRVRAQVMSRDEATGGWVALGGGGLSHVRVGKRRRAKTTPLSGDSSEDSSRSPPAHEYYICGVRISDDTEVLSCTIKKDFQYNKVMPTFHHWLTDEKRFGLTFQTAADARAFDRGVRTAIEELLDGMGGAWPSLHAYKEHNPAPREDDEENKIFECLHLPTDSRSSSENSTASRPQRRSEDITQTPILSAITVPSKHSPHCAETSLKRINVAGTDDDLSYPDHCSYVHLTAVHEYSYPPGGGEGGPQSPGGKRGRGEDDCLKKGICGSYGGPPSLPGKKGLKPLTCQSRLKCRHCHEWYLESGNRAGSCQYAPDGCRSCVDAASCIKCAQCLVYHCAADAEGDAAAAACACGPPSAHCAKRWIGVALLSLLVPCLCCYAPLRCAHRAARAAGAAGGRHAPLPAP